MSAKDTLKEKEYENWEIQFSRTGGGLMINARGGDVEYVYAQYKKACALADQVPVEDGTELPFYSVGDKCPKCKVGELKRKSGTGKSGKSYDFVGCDNYPACDYIEK
jgi:hypothetical protein